MARVADFIHAVKQIGPWGFAKRVWRETNEDNVFTNAAAMAYAWAFAVFPFLIFLLTLLPYLPINTQKATIHYIELFMYRSGMTDSVVSLVRDPLKAVMSQAHTGFLSLGLLLTLYAASGGMNTTMSALDEAFEVERPRAFIWKRLWAIVLTLFACLGVVIILIALPVSGLALHLLLAHIHELPLPSWVMGLINVPMLVLITFIRYLIGLFVMQLMIGFLYRFGPSHPHRLRFLSPGAIFATVGWIATGAGMRFYFTHFAETSYARTYGIVAGMIIMLLVFYLDGIIVLIGAEIDSEVEKCQHNPDGSVDCRNEQALDPTAPTHRVANPT